MPVTIDNRCNGCGACAFVCPISCIDMTDDEEGFLFPHVDMNACIDCGRCVRACPLNVQTLSNPQQALSFTSNDASLLDHSASGGAFSTMAKAFIAEGASLSVRQIMFAGGHISLLSERVLTSILLGVPSTISAISVMVVLGSLVIFLLLEIRCSLAVRLVRCRRYGIRSREVVEKDCI